MTSIFLIESGSYSDYHIVGVYDTKEKAELVLAAIRDDEAAIVERQLNPGFEELNSGLKGFCVTFLLNGELLDQPTESKYVLETSTLKSYNGYHLSVFARDADHAIKIGAEKVAELKAMEALNVQI